MTMAAPRQIPSNVPTALISLQIRVITYFYVLRLKLAMKKKGILKEVEVHLQEKEVETTTEVETVVENIIVDMPKERFRKSNTLRTISPKVKGTKLTH